MARNDLHQRGPEGLPLSTALPICSGRAPAMTLPGHFVPAAVLPDAP
jgi:hypothetical protein